MFYARAYVCMYVRGAHASFNQATKRWLLLTVCLNSHTISDDLNERLRLTPKLNIVSFDSNACVHFNAEPKSGANKDNGQSKLNGIPFSFDLLQHFSHCMCTHFSWAFQYISLYPLVYHRAEFIYSHLVLWIGGFCCEIWSLTRYYQMMVIDLETIRSIYTRKNLCSNEIH